jgi:signal peptidase I
MPGGRPAFPGYGTAVRSDGPWQRTRAWLFARRPDPFAIPGISAPGETALVELRKHRPRPSSAAPLEYEPVAEPTTGGSGSPWPPFLNRIRSLAILALIIVAGAFLLRTYVVETYYVPSASMEPTLHGCPNCNDDRVLVEKLSYLFHDPQPGDVVVFNRPDNGPWERNVPEKVLIKRIIGVGGDRIVIQHGHVFRDGRRLVEPYVNPACTLGTQAPQRVYLVPQNEVFVMGDNRCRSEDSRFNGPVPVSDLVGRAFLIVWPLSRVGSL